MTTTKTLKVIKVLIALSTICWLLAYTLAALNPYTNDTGWWLISLVGLLFPILFAGGLMLTVIWLFLNRRWALVCGIMLLLGWQSFFATFAFHIPKSVQDHVLGHQITVMSYNVHEFKPVIGEYRHGMERFWEQIKPVAPDILCLQELNNSDKFNYKGFPCLSRTKNALGMSFDYFSRDFYFFDSLIVQGSVIYTRFPVLDSGKINLTDLHASPSVIYADILAYSDTLRVMTTHLASFGLNKADYQDLHRIRHLQKGMFAAIHRIVGRFRQVFLQQNQQASRLSKIVKQSPYPVILCGDFNSVPNAFTYFKSRGSMQDSFLKKGLGIGTTYSRLSSTLRIDYIFADKKLKLSSFHIKRKLLSDHYPVIAKFMLP